MENEIECLYCGAMVPGREDDIPPAVDDDAAWRHLREFHAEDCEWVLTRTHRIEAQSEETD